MHLNFCALALGWGLLSTIVVLPSQAWALVWDLECVEDCGSPVLALLRVVYTSGFHQGLQNLHPLSFWALEAKIT